MTRGGARERHPLGRARRRHPAVRGRALLHQSVRSRSAPSAVSVWRCRWRCCSAASGTSCAPGRGHGAFQSGAVCPFLRLARVRLAAEAFSYLTLRGIAGEPLKVVLLERPRRSARGDCGGGARAPGLHDRHDHHRRAGIGDRDCGPAAHPSLVPRLPRVSPWPPRSSRRSRRSSSPAAGPTCSRSLPAPTAAGARRWPRGA